MSMPARNDGRCRSAAPAVAAAAALLARRCWRPAAGGGCAAAAPAAPMIRPRTPRERTRRRSKNVSPQAPDSPRAGAPRIVTPGLRRGHFGPLRRNERLRPAVDDLVLRRQLAREPLQRLVEAMRAEQRDPLAAALRGPSSSRNERSRMPCSSEYGELADRRRRAARRPRARARATTSLE